MPLLILTMLRAGWALRSDSQFTSLALLAVIAIISGTGFYSIVEGLRIVDALYLSVATLTTVGYGDLAPETDAGKLFTVVYMLVGVGILLAFVTTLAAKMSQTPALHPLKHQSAPPIGVGPSGDRSPGGDPLAHELPHEPVPGPISTGPLDGRSGSEPSSVHHLGGVLSRDRV
jgi:voltage-gated potassium channel